MKRLLCLVCLVAVLLVFIPAPAGAVSSGWSYIANVPAVYAGNTCYVRLEETQDGEKMLVFTKYEQSPVLSRLRSLAREISPGVYAVPSRRLKQEPCKILAARLAKGLDEWDTADNPRCLSNADPVVAAYRSGRDCKAVVLLGPDYSLSAPRYLAEKTAADLCRLAEVGAVDAGAWGCACTICPPKEGKEEVV